MSSNGLFCPGQGIGFSAPGCFGEFLCRLVHAAGVPAGPLVPPGTTSPLVLAATACTDTTSTLATFLYGLPGPVAATLTGTAVLGP